MMRRFLLVGLVIAGLLAAALPAGAQGGDQVFTGVVIQGLVESPHYELQTATVTYVLVGSQDFSQYLGKTVTIHGTVSSEPNIYMRGPLLRVTSIAADGQGVPGILPITDLGYSHWAAGAILYVKDCGAFGPGIPARAALDRPIAPEQFSEWCKLLLNAKTERETAIVDSAAPTAGWQSYVERGQALTMLLKLIGAKGAIATATGKEVYAGATDAFGCADICLDSGDAVGLGKLAEKAGLITDSAGLRPNDPLTMAEAATVLMRVANRYDMLQPVYSDAERYRTAALNGSPRVRGWYDEHHGRLMVRYLAGEWEMQQTTADSPLAPVWTEIPAENALRIMGTPATFSYEVKDGAVVCTFAQELGAGPHRLVVTLNAASLAVTAVTEYDH